MTRMTLAKALNAGLRKAMEDDPTKYRLSEDLEHWKLKDPIARVKAYLARSTGVDHDYFDQVDAEADEIAARLREGCLSMPDPTLTDFFDHVYVEQTPQLVEQQGQFAAYAASFEGEN
jgi:2-oxoisovalerate dehydrogenase E1 component alpha subunit